MIFQSTPSVWRETPTARPPSYNDAISIHSLRVEGDSRIKIVCVLEMYFNPLPPCGGRLYVRDKKASTTGISIHSLRVEGDPRTLEVIYMLPHFNPLPPCGGRPIALPAAGAPNKFQSTPSVWRETLMSLPLHFVLIFQSTPSVWRETRLVRSTCAAKPISIHSLRVEGDMSEIAERVKLTLISIHSLRVEGDCPERSRLPDQVQFQSTPSVWRETFPPPHLDSL